MTLPSNHVSSISSVLASPIAYWMMGGQMDGRAASSATEEVAAEEVSGPAERI